MNYKEMQKKANENPELRAKLVPLLKKTAQSKNFQHAQKILKLIKELTSVGQEFSNSWGAIENSWGDFDHHDEDYKEFLDAVSKGYPASAAKFSGGSSQLKKWGQRAEAALRKIK